jgi:hypothetical protein
MTYTTPFEIAPSANTPYRVFVGGGAIFNEDGKPVRITEITDGTSNTILYVHATEQVPWAAPFRQEHSPSPTWAQEFVWCVHGGDG